jgi:hypothetical protein
LRKKGAVPELVQLMSLGVVVHMNCVEAGELANSAMAETVAAQQTARLANAGAHRRATPRSHILRRDASNTFAVFVCERGSSFRKRMRPPPPMYCCSIGELARL